MHRRAKAPAGVMRMRIQQSSCVDAISRNPWVLGNTA